MDRHRGRMEIAGRVALVTGAGGGGTGRATAVRLAAEGARVVVADLDIEGARETTRRIEAAGGSAAPVRVDVTVQPDVREMLEFAEARFGGLDVLVNNAGGVPYPPYPESPGDQWGRTLAINLTAPMVIIQHALPMLERRGGGAIVNISSVAGLGHGPHGTPEYAAAKAGLIRLSCVLGGLAERSGIRVNCVVPNWILTEKVRARLEELSPAERATLPERMSTPEDIAGAVVHLVRDDRLAGRVMVCWTGDLSGLVAAGDVGYAGFEVTAEQPEAARDAASRRGAAAR
jgi:NAD(P)-dependent dehydrogenase (short-subunit alcohol dehydrogenase family)